jgi:hypothetical protein
VTTEEAKAEIRRLRQFIKDQNARERAAREAVLVEAFEAKQRLCEVVCKNTGLDRWQLEGRNPKKRYTAARALVYWKMHKLGYTPLQIGNAFGRGRSVEETIRYTESKLRVSERARSAAEAYFQN